MQPVMEAESGRLLGRERELAAVWRPREPMSRHNRGCMEPPAGDELVPRELFDQDVYDDFYGALLEQGGDAQARLIAELGGLHAGAHVLDAPCGDGRIAVRLAGMGCRVVGLDLSERFIARARQRPGGDSVRFEVGDLRALDHDAAFDCVVNWFTSFGYFDASTNRAVLRAYRRALRPGGRLVLEQRNPALLRRAVDAGGGTAAHVMDRGLDLLVDRVSLVGDRSRTERFVVRDGRVRKLEFSLEIFDGDALTAALREAGFAEVQLVDERGEPFSADSARLVAVARTNAQSPAEP
jgi:SAM-dependent methyltransferase